jgi:WD40 repeat protein
MEISIFDLKKPRAEYIFNFSNLEFIYIDSFSLFKYDNKVLLIISQSQIKKNNAFSKLISYDLNKNIQKIIQIPDSFNNMFVYHDTIDYIIGMNNKHVFSLEYDDENSRKIFITDNPKKKPYNAIIIGSGEQAKLIYSCADNNLRILNFHSGDLINIIELGSIVDFCPLYNDKLIVGLKDGNIKIVNINQKSIISEQKGHSAGISTVKGFIKENKRFLISQSSVNDSKIKIWKINNIIDN